MGFYDKSLWLRETIDNAAECAVDVLLPVEHGFRGDHVPCASLLAVRLDREELLQVDSVDLIVAVEVPAVELYLFLVQSSVSLEHN